ncbi:MAG: hypothetical protein ACRC57_05285 [Sarcina sp.]
MRIGKYTKIIDSNNYYKFYKTLKKDYKKINSLISNKQFDSKVDAEMFYFNFLLYLWDNAPNYKSFSECFNSFPIDNSDYSTFESYEEYINRDSVKELLNQSENADEKMLELRKYNYIHRLAIEKIVLDNIKNKIGVHDLEHEFILTRLTANSNERFIDDEGTYKDNSSESNYFYDIYFLTDECIIYHPLNIKYEPVQDTKQFFSIRLENIKSIYFTQNKMLLNIKLINNSVITTYIASNTMGEVFRKVLEEYLSKHNLKLEEK